MIIIFPMKKKTKIRVFLFFQSNQNDHHWSSIRSMCQNQSIGCYGNESDSIFFFVRYNVNDSGARWRSNNQKNWWNCNYIFALFVIIFCFWLLIWDSKYWLIRFVKNAKASIMNLYFFFVYRIFVFSLFPQVLMMID